MDFPPNRLTIYDVKKLKSINSFKPGVFGKFSWSKTNKIILEYGAGTSNNISIFDTDGRLIYNGYKNSDLWEASYITLNPTNEYIVMLPEYEHHPGFIEIIRVDDGKIWIRKLEKIVAFEYKWKSEGLLEIVLLENGNAGNVIILDVYEYVNKNKFDKEYNYAD